jgi:hypothetical protein
MVILDVATLVNLHPLPVLLRLRKPKWTLRAVGLPLLRPQHPATLLRYEYKIPSKRRTSSDAAIRRSSMQVIAVDLTTFSALRRSLHRFVRDPRCTNEGQPSRVTHRSSEADRRGSQMNLEVVAKLQAESDRARGQPRHRIPSPR